MKLENFLKIVKETKLQEIKYTRVKPDKAFSPKRKSLKNAIRTKEGVCIIAEIKKGSPSLGEIRKDLCVRSLAKDFEAAGVCGISVITDRTFFFSDFSFLDHLTDLSSPVLRKDFIIDPVQIEETAMSCASSLLLIVRFIEDKKRLKHLFSYSCSLGLEPVVEVFDDSDVKAAKEIGASLIMVNNRDLNTLKVNLSVSKRLIRYKKDREIWISASGIENHEQIKELMDLGFDCFLIGTSIMKSSDPVRFIKELKGEI